MGIAFALAAQASKSNGVWAGPIRKSISENFLMATLSVVRAGVRKEISYNAPDLDSKSIVIDAAFVKERLTDVVKDEDLSRYIL